jgi:hypothetical protein
VRVERGADAPGGHTDDILRDAVGMGGEEIAALRRDEVIGPPDGTGAG